MNEIVGHAAAELKLIAVAFGDTGERRSEQSKDQGDNVTLKRDKATDGRR